MIKVENIEVWGFEHAIRGMRNPMNSWDRSDSEYKVVHVDQFSLEETKEFIVGEKDLDLMKRLYKAGPEHRKYLRQIFVSMDITAPHYWWYDFDTYKVGVVRNSCSKQHKLMSKPFELDDFSHEHLCGASIDHLEMLIDWLNDCRKSYVEQKHKEDWWQVMQLLPLSYNHKSTITMNYENVVSIIKQRANHNLDEFREFVRILDSLPYIHEIMEE